MGAADFSIISLFSLPKVTSSSFRWYWWIFCRTPSESQAGWSRAPSLEWCRWSCFGPMSGTGDDTLEMASGMSGGVWLVSGTSGVVWLVSGTSGGEGGR